MTRLLALPFAILVLVALAWGPALGQSADTPSGLPLPRFVSVAASPVNVRVGPGTNYAIAWTFIKPSLPVEIVQEFDTWRKIRDHDGEEGWIHGSLLSGERTALVLPWAQEGQTAMRESASPAARVLAWLTPGLLVHVSRCDGTMCQARLSHQSAGRNRTFSGYIAQGDLWGVYADEKFD